VNTGIINVKFTCVEKDKCLYPLLDCNECPAMINLFDDLNRLANDVGSDFIVETKEK
jgi:hypothetical protein